MSVEKISQINKGYELAVTPPEEGAGLSYLIFQNKVLSALGISHVTLPMDLEDRIITNTKDIDDASKYVKNNKNVTFVKGPGITPKGDQLIAKVIELEQKKKLIFKDPEIQKKVEALREKYKPTASNPDSMIQFAYEILSFEEKVIKYGGKTLEGHTGILKKIGSPNAKWREDLIATLGRGDSDGLVERSLAQPAKWDGSVPFESYGIKAVEGENMKTGKTISNTKGLTLVFETKTKREEVPNAKWTNDVAAGSGVKAFIYNEEKIANWLNGVEKDQEKKPGVLDKIKAKGQNIIQGTKVRVTKLADSIGLAVLGKSIETKELGNNIDDMTRVTKDGKNQLKDDLLIDDVMGNFASKAPEKPTAFVITNHSYSQIAEFWERVQKNGGFKNAKNLEILRASGTQDHYSGLAYLAKEDGVAKLVDDKGNTVIEAELKKGEAVFTTLFEKSRAETLARQAFERAAETGKDTLIFAFGNDEYYKPIIEEAKKLSSKYSNIKVEFADPMEGAAKYFTSGKDNIELVVNNIFGDFLTDIEKYGKGTMYSIAILPDGRKAVELGALGTAPDRITDPRPEKRDGWKEEGIFVYNPMAQIEGTGYALMFAASNMRKNGESKESADLVEATGKALIDGMYATLDKGIVLPFIKGKFKKNSEEYTSVGTQTFFQSVLNETYKKLEEIHPVATKELIESTEKELQKNIQIDKVMFETIKKHGRKENNFKWEDLNTKYSDARIAAGAVDPNNPDFSIPLPIPQNGDLSKVTSDNLLKLQEARVNLISAVKENKGVDEAKSKLQSAVENFGLPRNQAVEYAKNDITIAERANSNSLSRAA